MSAQHCFDHSKITFITVVMSLKIIYEVVCSETSVEGIWNSSIRISTAVQQMVRNEKEGG